MLRPDANAEVYARQNHLHAFAQWVNLLQDIILSFMDLSTLL